MSGPVKLIAPLRQAELRALFAAQLLGGLGDWAGRLAISLLVFDRSESALWAALVVAAVGTRRHVRILVRLARQLRPLVHAQRQRGLGHQVRADRRGDARAA